jgi:polyhydroxyalkanoate synthesis repressor PhaR
MEAVALIIKKYGNRRLYDSSNSRYVNLDDIASFLREGKDVKVVDAKTGQDLTRVTLTQIITEDAKNRPSGLPLELLRQLVLASDEVRQEFLMWYLKHAFETFETVQDAVRSRLGQVQSAILSPVDIVKQLLGSTPSSEILDSRTPKRANRQTEEDHELDVLRKRVAELEARLKKPSRQKQGSGRKYKNQKKRAV